MRIYGERWKIRQDMVLRAWTAERREGNAIRFIVGLTARELADRLAQAERAEPPERPGGRRRVARRAARAASGRRTAF